MITLRLLSTVRCQSRLSPSLSPSSSLSPSPSLSTTVRGLHRTVLHDFHVKQGAKMVEFAGYSMPLMYGKVGVAPSHLHVRKGCGLFDVSHMLQTKISGQHSAELLESLTVADVEGLAPGTGCLSLFTNERGGIQDDLIINKTKEGYLYVVSNAGCRDKDLRNLQRGAAALQQEGKDVQLQVCWQDALLALQGPLAAQVLQSLVDVPLAELGFMHTLQCRVGSVDRARVTRCGYTGEDGFEISVPNDKAVELCRSLLANDAVRLTGLAARDSLRLEAGLCLYGNDISEDTSPVEGSLVWTIAKRRRKTADFPGAEKILSQIKTKQGLRRVGIVSAGPPVRPPTQVFDQEGNKIGQVTSGCPSPSLGANISMAYVPLGHHKAGTPLTLKVRGKDVPGTVTKMPFVPTNYYVNKA